VAWQQRSLCWCSWGTVVIKASESFFSLYARMCAPSFFS
jgi:hypothetical protein